MARAPALSDLPAMIATLCSYENCFGPHHPHTLRLMVSVARALESAGDSSRARSLLESAARDLQRLHEPGSELDGLVSTALREMRIAPGEHSSAGIGDAPEPPRPAAQAAGFWHKPH